MRGWFGHAGDSVYLMDLYPLTRIPSLDAIRPLPASGAR